MQRLIDIPSLFEPIGISQPRLGDPLTPRQINQVYRTGFLRNLILGEFLPLYKLNGYDRVGSGTILVHKSRSERSIFGPLLHPLLNLPEVMYSVLRHPIDVHPQFLTLSDFEAAWWTLSGVGNEQILYLLVVDFDHADGHLEQLVLFGVSADAIEYLFAGERDDSFVGSEPDHGVGLAGPRLPIRKQTAVVPLPTSAISRTMNY